MAPMGTAEWKRSAAGGASRDRSRLVRDRDDFAQDPPPSRHSHWSSVHVGAMVRAGAPVDLNYAVTSSIHRLRSRRVKPAIWTLDAPHVSRFLVGYAFGVIG